jgi:TIR domain
MSDIFVSYSNEDRDRVLPLVTALQEAGWSVFWDRAIPAGKTWREVIGSEIQTCRCVVVAWSRKSVESHWVQEEAETGKQKCILIPVLLDYVEPPFGFRSIQAANLTDWNGDSETPAFRRLVADIAAILGAAKTAENPEPVHSRSDAEGQRVAAPKDKSSASAQDAPQRSGATSPKRSTYLNPRHMRVGALAVGILVLAVIGLWMSDRNDEPVVPVSENVLEGLASMAVPTQSPPDPAPELSNAMGELVASWEASHITSAPAAGCSKLLFDIANGKLNSLAATASQDEVKQALPCSTGSSPDGGSFNYGGGVFFLDHDFFFYTGSDFIEVRRNFSGDVSIPLLGVDRNTVRKQLDSPYMERENVWLFSRPYGCLRITFTANKVSAIGSHYARCDWVASMYSTVPNVPGLGGLIIRTPES